MLPNTTEVQPKITTDHQILQTNTEYHANLSNTMQNILNNDSDV